MHSNTHSKSAIEELSMLDKEELAQKLLSARDDANYIAKERDKHRASSSRLSQTLETVMELLWIEICDTEPKLGRNDVISIANRAREMLALCREQREIPF